MSPPKPLFQMSEEQPIAPPPMTEEHHRKTHRILFLKAILLILIGSMEVELMLSLRATNKAIEALQNRQPFVISAPIAKVILTNGVQTIFFTVPIK